MLLRRPALALVLSSCLFLTTACASTVQVGQTTAGSATPAAVAGGPTAAGDDGLGVAPAGGGAPAAATGPGSTQVSGASGTGGTTATAGAGGTTSSGAAPAGSGAANGGGTGDAQPVAAENSGGGGGGRQSGQSGGSQPTFAPGTPGVTADEIKVGFSYNADADDAAAATGSKTSGGDQRRYHDVMLDYINGTGGVLDRKVVPAFYVGNATTAKDQQSQEACAQWTQDDKVFAAVTSLSTDVLRQCLHNAGIPGLNTYPLGASDDRTFAQFPMWVETSTLSLNTLGRVYPTGLAQQGFFKGPNMKLGLVYNDRPQFVRAVEEDLKPTLAELGIELSAEATARIEGYADLAPGSSRMANIVLQFQRQGITNVMFFEPWLGYGVFMQQAEKQAYRPRYGLNSNAIPQIAIETGIIPVEQFRNARLVGWLPNFDVPAFDGSTPTLRLCNEIYRKAGVSFPDRNAKGIGLIICDQHLQFRRSMNLAPQPIDGAGLIRGAEAQGGIDVAAVGLGTLGPRRHYGVDRYRKAAFDSSCPCFRYTSGTTSMR